MFRAPLTCTLTILLCLASGLVQAQPPSWPERVFAPYVDAVAWPPFDLVATAQSQDVRYFSLGFIVAQGPGNCTPSWGGYHDMASQFRLAEITNLRSMGGDVIVSFGGAAGTELAGACTSVTQLQASYQLAIDTYSLTHIDFDIEGYFLGDPASIQRRSQAIAGLQANAASQGRELEVWFTLPVLPTGLTWLGVGVLQSALQYGVDIAGVNIMAMDYGPANAPNPNQMGAYAIQAANAVHAQLQPLFPTLSSWQIWRRIGVTPMIGVNDVQGEVFYTSDAQQLLSFAQAQDMGMLSFWSLNRDQACPGGPSPWASPTCSGIAQVPFAFAQIFQPYTSGTWTNLGYALAGSAGPPRLQAAGLLSAGSTLNLTVSNAPMTASGLLIAGLSAPYTPMLGGMLVPSMDMVLPLTTDPSGAASWSALWPAGVPSGLSVFWQVAAADPGAPFGVVATNALESRTP